MNTSFKYSLAALIIALPATSYAQMDSSPRNNDAQQNRQVTPDRDSRHADQTRETKLKDDKNHKAGVRVSKYIGKSVYNHENKKVGEIQDLVMDGGYNRISYAVLSFGGFMGMGNKYFAIPWSSLEYRAEQEDRLFLNITEQKLKDAPGFDKNAWPDTANSAFRTQVDNHYGVNRNDMNPDDARQRTTANPSDRSNTTPSQNQQQTDQRRSPTADGRTGTDRSTHDANQRRSNPASNQNELRNDGTKQMSGPTEDGLLWARRASQVIDADIKNTSDQDVGEIEDLIVEPRSGKIVYVIIDLKRDMRSAERYVAIPISKLRTHGQEEEFILSLGRNELRNAPSFKSSQWPDWSDQQFRNRVDSLSSATPSNNMDR